MANKVIARVRLAPGHSGYYDEKSGIYLNWSHPEKDIVEGTDISDLRRSARLGTIEILSGTLGHSKTFKQILMEGKAKRTGEPLKSLMGDTPIVDADGNYVTDDTKEDTKAEPQKPTTTVDVTPEKKDDKQSESADTKDETPVAPKRAAAKQAPKVEAEPKEEVVPVSLKPSSIRSLNVGSTRDITASAEVTKVSSSDEKVVTAIADGTKITVEGIAEGKADVTVETAKNGSAVLSVTVTAAK